MAEATETAIAAVPGSPPGLPNALAAHALAAAKAYARQALAPETLRALPDDLDQINDYTRNFHHGDDPTDGAADQYDPTEMHGYVRKTLKISNNLQA